MSEPVTEDLKQETHSPSQKRKRGGDSPAAERRTKRTTAASNAAPAPAPAPAPGSAAAPPANMSGSEPLNHAFLANAAAQATANVDLSALQQANEAAVAAVAAANTSAQTTQPPDAANASSTAAAALGSMYPSMQVPTSTDQQFAESANANQDSPPQEASFAEANPVTQAEGTSTSSAANVSPGDMMPTNGTPQPGQQHRRDYQFRKPAVGTEEWHKLRKDNHKEVERRRRETINEGINELAKIVPNCEKNKGSILQKAVQYIQQMKANESSNIEKWTLEKLLTEQAIAELTAANDKLKAENEQLYQEKESYKKACKTHGIDVEPSAGDGSDDSG